jgi:DNA-binding NarL/FixJ family response regulator
MLFGPSSRSPAMPSHRNAMPGRQASPIVKLKSSGSLARGIQTASSPRTAKTVGRHIENIYGKIGVSSRAAAALFAMEHQIIHA